MFLNYIESTGSQWINTEYTPKAEPYFEMEIKGGFTSDAGDFHEMGVVGGSSAARYDWGMVGTYAADNLKNVWSFGCGYSANNTADTSEHEFAANFGTGVFKVDNIELAISPSVQCTTEDGHGTFFLFMRQNVDWENGCYCNFRMRSCRLSQGTEAKRDFLPMRAEDGRIGLYDRVESKFYPNNGSGTFVWDGFTYTTGETALLVREGKFVANENFGILGYDSVEKVGDLRLDASACLSYPVNLKLAKGVFSQQDNAAKSYTVDGTLTFVGGAEWAVDWVEASCDSFTATSVDLTQASEASPVQVIVNTAATATLDPDHPVVLLNSGVVAEDAKKFVASGVSAQFEVQDGKLLMRFADATVPVRAEWTGKGGRGKVSDKQNWTCYNCFNDELPNALPTDKTVVTIPANLAGKFEWLAGETLACRSFKFPESFALEQDCDWQGMTVPMNGTITLNGKKLSLKSLEGSGMFTDSSDPGGELVVDIPEGQTLTYSGDMKLTGTLKLVKTGGGTLRGASGDGAKKQTFTGGTEILGGTVLASGYGDDYRWGGFGAGSSTTITICTNGVFELNGNKNFDVYTFVLNGGTLKNSTKFTDGDPWNLRGVKAIRLESDSFLDFTGYSIMDWDGSNRNPTSIDLQGHTLTVTFSNNDDNRHCYLSNVTVTPGTLVLNGTILLTGGEFNGPKATIDLNGYLNIENDVHVGTYICKTTDARPDLAARANNLFVYERFKPITDKFWGCELKSGATLDLSEWKANEDWEAWNVKGTFGHTIEEMKVVKFEDNATITVDLGARQLKSGDYVVVWDDATKPANLSTLRFKLADGRRGSISKAADGLRFTCGLTIFIH